MRIRLLALPLAFFAAQAVAQPAPRPEQIQIPSGLTDPAMADKLANMMGALSKAFLNLPVGEVQAAAEGRAPTPAERNLTIRDLGRRNDPNFERNFQQQIAQSGPMIRQSMETLVRTLPAMMKPLSEMAQEMERATANLPRPDYPRR
jgi:hypothetical protein